MKKIYLTGIKPTGYGMHLGNYFGIIQQIINIAKDKNNIIFLMLADYHSLTTIHNKEELKKNKEQMLKEIFSFFIGYENIIIYEQSEIKGLLDIFWLLSSVTPYSLLKRAHAFKDAKEKGKDINMSLFNYPLLMAADILSLDTDIVPIGKDQIQHIEFTNDIGGYFNNKYKIKFFKKIDFIINKNIEILQGIDGQKMSKSYGNTIPIFLDEKIIKKQIMLINTDDIPLKESKDPEKCNVFKYIKLFGNENEIKEIANNYLKGGYGYGHAKNDLLKIYLNYFKKERDAFNNIKIDEIFNILQKNNKFINELVEKKIYEMKKIVGII